MTTIDRYIPGCCSGGNQNIDWVCKDDHLPTGQGRHYTGWDTFHGWGLHEEPMGHFPIYYCPWCGTHLADPVKVVSRVSVTRAHAIRVSNKQLQQEIKDRKNRARCLMRRMKCEDGERE